MSRSDSDFIKRGTVIVAGLPASGKSTFISGLQRGRANLFKNGDAPTALTDWSEVSSNDPALRAGLKLQRHIIHYDLLQPLRNGLTDLKSDDAVQRQLRLGPVIVINVETDLRSLIERERARRDEQRRRRGWRHTWRKDFIHRPLRRAAFRFGLKPVPHALDLYERFPSLSNDIYAEWLGLLESAGRGNPDLEVTSIDASSSRCAPQQDATVGG